MFYGPFDAHATDTLELLVFLYKRSYRCPSWSSSTLQTYREENVSLVSANLYMFFSIYAEIPVQTNFGLTIRHENLKHGK